MTVCTTHFMHRKKVRISMRSVVKEQKDDLFYGIVVDIYERWTWARKSFFSEDFCVGCQVDFLRPLHAG